MSRHAPMTKTGAPPPAGHEPAHIHARGVVWLAIAVAGGCLLVVAVVFFMTGWLGMPAGQHEQRLQRVDVQPPQPRLQPDPEADLAAYTRQKHVLLHDYRWLDRNRSIARIPIERAMQLLSQPGSLPDRPSAPPPASARPQQ